MMALAKYAKSLVVLGSKKFRKPWSPTTFCLGMAGETLLKLGKERSSTAEMSESLTVKGSVLDQEVRSHLMNSLPDYNLYLSDESKKIDID